MTPQEIKEAYLENLKAYNALFPIYSDGRISPEELGLEESDSNSEGFFVKFQKRFKEIFPKLKEAADQSWGAKVWHRGDPLDDLSPGMKARIQEALRDEISSSDSYGQKKSWRR